jgi:uridylate kinase
LGKSEKLAYRRILLKISGEAIQGRGSPFDLERIDRIVREIDRVRGLDVEVGLVIGGGNIVRGRELAGAGLSRIKSDYMGMLATVINGVLFQSCFTARGISAVLTSPLAAGAVVETENADFVERSLREKRVVIFSGGTGNPFFTTDSAAALRGCEIGAQVLLKATKVDGVYDRDPAVHHDARFYPEITYDDVLERSLEVMDMTAVSMCRDNRLPIIVFNVFKESALERIVTGEKIGTMIKE